MRLVLKQVTEADIERSATFCDPQRGFALAPALALCWTVDERDTKNLKARAIWSAEQQRDIYSQDPTARFIQVIDEDADGELVSLGRWHEYPNGYKQFATLEIAGCKDINLPTTWPAGLDREAYTDLLVPLFAERQDWMTSGHCWVLTTVYTREPYRRNGAASMIMNWGLAQAKEAGVPAYLEAAPAAKGTYEKHGFREVGRQRFTLGGESIELSRMEA